jgi:hypothetical protein
MRLSQGPTLPIGSLPTITEGIVRNEIDDPSGLLGGTVPPTSEVTEKQSTIFHFHAQLTWGLEPSPSVNLPRLFREWVKNTSQCLPDFALLPYDDEKGQVITFPSQDPDDNSDFFQDYYYNHRPLA